MPAIETHDLRKTYYQPKKAPGLGGAIRGLFSRDRTAIEAVKGIDLEVAQGEIVGFLGPNGAGKTTTIKMLTGILNPTSGTAQVLGYRPFERRPDLLRQIALVMGNKAQLWWDLPAWESFVVLREVYDVDPRKFKTRVDTLIELLDLKDKVHTQVRRLSLGERMKCELVAALLHAPRVLFLDEPTIGLDVVSQKRIRDFLRQVNREEQCSIVLTSHYMQDVLELCERVVVIDHGSKVFDGTLSSLTGDYSDTRRLRLSLDETVDPARFAEYGEVVEFEANTVVLAIPRDQTAARTGEILQAFPVNDIAVEEVSVDEVIRHLFESGQTNPAHTGP